MSYRGREELTLGEGGGWRVEVGDGMGWDAKGEEG